MGEHAADDGRLLRRGRGRCGRRHGAAVRRRARAARRLLPPDRAQHPEPAGRGGAPRPACSTRPAAPGTSSRSPTPWRRRRGTGSPRSSGPAAWWRRWTRGWSRDRIAAAWEERAERLAHRTDAITGVSEFPNLAEKLPDREPAAGRCRAGGLPRVRAAQEFEELRDAADAAPSGPGSTWPRSARSPGTPPARASPATCSRPAASRRRPGTASRASPRPGRRSPASAAPTRTTRADAAGLAAELREAGATPGVAGRQAGPRGRRRGRIRVRRLRRARRRCAPCTSSWEASHEPDPRLRLRRAGPPGVRRATRRRLGQGVQGGHRPRRRGGDLGDAGGHRRPAAVHPGRPRGPGLPRHLPGHRALPARALPDDVHDPAVDGPAVRRASPPPRSPTRSTGATSPPGRRGCRSPSTCPPTAATTPTTRGWSATSAWRGSRSTRSWTCGSSSTASRWTG